MSQSLMVNVTYTFVIQVLLLQGLCLWTLLLFMDISYDKIAIEHPLTF